jgi:TRAP-type mannitol/chloroaromatic compound transport system permease small subunit
MEKVCLVDVIENQAIHSLTCHFSFYLYADLFFLLNIAYSLRQKYEVDLILAHEPRRHKRLLDYPN